MPYADAIYGGVMNGSKSTMSIQRHRAQRVRASTKAIGVAMMVVQITTRMPNSTEFVMVRRF